MLIKNPVMMMAPFVLCLIISGSGYIVLPLIRKDFHTDHVVLQKKLHFPWKTDAFKGIVEVIQNEDDVGGKKNCFQRTW